MSTRALGVAIVGAGMMGRNHARAWAAVPEARLVAVADIDRGRAESLAGDYGALALSDFRAAVDRDDVDIVSVCIPAHYHPDVTIFAAEHGKHVLCEKPLALTIERAEAMIATARRCQVRLGIGFQLRQLRTTTGLRRLLAEGAIGRPVMWVYSFAMQIRPKVAMHDMLTGNGGPVVDFCPHRFDLWRLGFDSEAVAVQASGLTLAKERPELSGLRQVAPDTVSLLVRYASGDVGSLAITWGLPPGVNGSALAEVWGARGLIVADLDRLRLLTEGGHEATFGPYGEDAMVEAMALQAQAFVRAAQSGCQPSATGEDGLVALRVSLAAIRSLESGESVDPRELR
ncbi:MAG: Gfo/Idh/MocA family protein [Anaerolineae bacterium]